MSKKGLSPWIYFGCGCLAFALILVGACVGGVFMLGKWGKDFGEQLADPVARTERAMEMLGTDQLPEGFNAQFFLSVPFFMDMVMLSDGEPVEYQEGEAQVESRDLGENALFYLSMRDMGDQREQFEKALDGKMDDADVNMNFDFDPELQLGSGEMELGSQHIRYSSFRGRFRDDSGHDMPGIYTIMLIDCPSTSRLRMAFYWSQNDPGGGVEADFSGTPADEDTLRSFMGHFDLCAK